MGFVNEYISKEDIEKYNIFGIWNKFLPEREQVKKETEKRYIPQWVIDREKEIWFSYAGRVIDQDLDFGQGTGEEIWYLNYKGKNLEVRLFKPPYLEFQGFSSDKKTYKRTWRFLSVIPESLDGVSNKELRDIIKKALDIYGESGMSSQVDRKDIELTFENFFLVPKLELGNEENGR